MSLEAHKELLGAIERAAKAAAALADTGAKISNVHRRLADCRKEIEGRIKYLTQPAAKTSTPAATGKSAADRKSEAVKKAQEKSKDPLVPGGPRAGEVPKPGKDGETKTDPQT